MVVNSPFKLISLDNVASAKFLTIVLCAWSFAPHNSTTPPYHVGVSYGCTVSAVVFSFCRLQLRKWYAQLLLSRKSQLESVSDANGDFPQSKVTLVADHAIIQNQFNSFLQRSMSVLRQQGDKPAPDQGVELMGVVPEIQQVQRSELITWSELSSNPPSHFITWPWLAI